MTVPPSDPTGRNTAHAFRDALAEPAHRRPVSEDPVVSPSPAVPLSAPDMSGAERGTVPSREPTTVLAGPAGRDDGEADTEPALDRPGAPVLAGAAIAGALLVVAPFAVSAGMPAVSLSTVAPQSPVSIALGDQAVDGPARVDGDVASVADAGGGSPVTANAADPGFVPRIQEGSTDPSLPDPGPASDGTGAVEASAPATQEANASPQESTATSTGTEATTTEEGSPEVDEENTPTSTENDTTGTDTAPATETETETADPGVSGEETPAQPSLEGADAPESASILQNTTETIAPVEERYRALAGPGCAGTTDSSYRGDGRWESAEGPAGWATRPGGYDQEGCEGSYEAIPVSGDPDKGDHQYAEWTFAPGEEGAVCEIYVHVPEDENPLWVATGDARYRIHPGGESTEPPVAVFEFDQSEVSGGWVQVTGFVSPTEAFTVRLTNAGQDPFPDDEHMNAHVAASAMRADCS